MQTSPNERSAVLGMRPGTTVFLGLIGTGMSMDSEEFERPVVMNGHEWTGPVGPFALEAAAVDLDEEGFECEHSSVQSVVG